MNDVRAEDVDASYLPGANEIYDPLSLPGEEDIPDSFSILEPLKSSKSDLENKLALAPISLDISPPSEPAVEEETELSQATPVADTTSAAEGDLASPADNPSQGEEDESSAVITESISPTDDPSKEQTDEFSAEVTDLFPLDASPAAEDDNSLVVAGSDDATQSGLDTAQSGLGTAQELLSELDEGNEIKSPLGCEKNKDLMKSDSTDSAFEATEELGDSDIPEGRQVHLEIFHPDQGPRFIETSYETEKSGKMLEDCDNIGMEKLNGLPSPGHKDISIQ